ncbi:MAG: c-type cytochrome [bacterium]|nr:c-type cytochrome [bacterium]
MLPRTTPTHRVLALSLAALLAVGAWAQGGGVGLSVRTDPALGAHVVDADGRTLYLFTKDDAGQSACTEACAQNWPPLLADGDVGAGEGIDAALLGTTERSDGGVQVTYGGWPLYAFVGDAAAGDVNGQARNDVWFAVAPDGTGIGAPQAAEGGDDVAALMNEGAAVFARICAACHGTQGNEALASHVVILAGNDRLGNEKLVLRRVIHGNGYMPGFGGTLSDREVAAVATYVRNSFGHDFGPVGEEAVAANR